MTNEPILTVVVPVYDEQDNLERVGRELAAWLDRTTTPARVLFVNDGSKDRSAAMIEALCAADPRFRFVHLAENAGLSAAMKAGFDHVETRYAGYIDSDLQTSPEDFDLLMPFAADHALVTGIRVDRKDTFVKNASSRIANAIRRSFTHDGATDVARRIPFFKGMHRFLPALVQLDGGAVKEVPVRHFPRVAGQSKYHLWNRLLGPAEDLLAFRWMRSRYIRYRIASKG